MSTDPEQPRPVNDTPRTDAASETIYSESIFGRHIVDVDFARQIERELNESNRMWAKWQNKAVTAEGEVSRLSRIDWNLVMSVANKTIESLRAENAALKQELNDWKSGARAESEALDKANRELAAALDRVKELMADNLKTENARLRSVLESIYNEGRGSEVFPPSPDDGHDGLKFLAVQQAINPSPV